MKNASDFIIDMRRYSELCDILEKKFSQINTEDTELCVSCIVEVGQIAGYKFSNEDYKIAAEEFSKNNILKNITPVNEKIINNSWTTGGHSCVSTCPTRSDVC